MNLRLKRVYDPPCEEDGCRILVDRLWPRGLTKEKAHLDLWLKDIAPSPELRTYFCHDPAKWEQFRDSYLNELGRNSEAVATLRERLQQGTVTLLYGARDNVYNHAVVISEFLGGGRAQAGR